jgi:hypothetical protein
MSFYLRKSIGLGPMRVSLSTRGLGASIGVPGLRVGAGPRGAYVSLAGGVVSYRATTRRPPRSRAAATTASQLPPGAGPASDVVLADVSGATTLEMTDSDASDLVRQLNAAASSWAIWPWALVATLILGALLPWLLIVGLLVVAFAAWKDILRRRVVAFYDVPGAEEQRRYQALVDAFATAQHAQKAWHVVESGAIRTDHQRKVNAGASNLVSNLPLTRGLAGPRHLRTNIAVPSMTTPRRGLYLLPDRVLVRDGNHYASVTYSELRAEDTQQRFIEDGQVPPDSRVLGHTWQYVNKSGGPDRRFNNNRQLPILEYGRLTLVGTNGYRGILSFSTPKASSALAAALRVNAAPLPASPLPRAPMAPRSRSHAARSAPAPELAEPFGAPRWATAPQPEAPGRPANAIKPARHRRHSSKPLDLGDLDSAALTGCPTTPLHRVPDASPAEHEQADSEPLPEWDGSGDNPPRFSPIELELRPLNTEGRVPVAGESYYQRALNLVAQGRAFPEDFDAHLAVQATLVPEPDNPWDGNAVRVDVVLGHQTLKVGYLPASRAARYQPRLLSLAATGVQGVCPARICGGGDGRDYGIYLFLSHARDVLDDDRAPSGLDGRTSHAHETATSVTLASAWNCTVTGEEDHQEVLAPFESSTGQAKPLRASLAFCTIVKGKYRGQRAIEVRLDERRVGQLTRAMTERYEAVVDDVHASGRTALCDAWVVRTDRGLQVELGMPVDPQRRQSHSVKS